MALTSSVLLPAAIDAVTGLVPNSSSITHLAFATVSFFTRFFLFFCRLRLFCVLPFPSAFASSTHFVFSSLLENRRERKRDVLKKDCWEIRKKGVCSICLIICCWVPSEAAASFSRSKTCATHNESDGFDGRWRRVSSFSSIAIRNSERRRAWQEYLIYGNGSIITSLCLRIWRRWRSRRMTSTLSIVSWVCTLHQCWAVTQFGQSNTGLHFLHLSSYYIHPWDSFLPSLRNGKPPYRNLVQKACCKRKKEIIHWGESCQDLCSSCNCFQVELPQKEYSTWQQFWRLVPRVPGKPFWLSRVF